MILLFLITTILLQGFVMGCFTYCGLKIFRMRELPRRWRVYFSSPYFAFAFYSFVILLTAIFAPRPVHIVWWVMAARFVALLALVAGIALPTFFFFGLINGGNYAKDEPETE